MEPNSHVITESHVTHGFSLPHGLKMTGRQFTFPTNIFPSYSVNPVPHGSASTSLPHYPQGFLTSQVPTKSQDTFNNTRRQQKHGVFTEDQNLVLQEHFNKCKFLKKEECMELAQRFGLNEHHIKVCLL